MKTAIFLAVFVLALLFGVAVALGGTGGLVFVLPIGIGLALLFDYRIGVIFLAVMLPFSSSPYLPQSQGLNPMNYALWGSVLVLLLKKLLKHERIVWPPPVLIICMIIPVFVGVLMGIPYLDEASRNTALFRAGVNFSLEIYLKQFLYRSLTFVIFAVLIANAIVDSKRPERFVGVFALSVCVTVLYLIGATLASGVALGDHRWVIGKLGMHYNEYGKLLAMAFGPLLFVTHAVRGKLRLFFGISLLILVCGIIFTFARAAILSSIVVLLIFLYQKNNIKLGIASFTVILIVILLAPAAWQDRMLYGFAEKELAAVQSGKLGENFSSGRIGSWIVLAPDVALSPVYGRGTSSTAWNSAVRDGTYESAHAHNLYLGALLDIGIIGLILVLYMYYRFIKSMNILSKDKSLDYRIRAFFSGSAASMFGMLALAVTGGTWYPHVDQIFLWFIFGFVIAYWSRANVKSPKANATLSQISQGNA